MIRGNKGTPFPLRSRQLLPGEDASTATTKFLTTGCAGDAQKCLGRGGQIHMQNRATLIQDTNVHGACMQIDPHSIVFMLLQKFIRFLLGVGFIASATLLLLHAAEEAWMSIKHCA